MARKSKTQRQEERQIISEYHRMVTEEALEPLFLQFLEWKEGTLPYDELTEYIHQFHKRNQEIYQEFEYSERDELVLYAKMKLNRLTDDDLSRYGRLLEAWGYQGDVRRERKFSKHEQNQLRKWDSIPEDTKKRILESVWCGGCSNMTSITQYEVEPLDVDVVLRGICPICGHEVARLVEVDE